MTRPARRGGRGILENMYRSIHQREAVGVVIQS
jgi:hypothetical protein